MNPIAIGAFVGALSAAVLIALAPGEPPLVSADGTRTIVEYGRKVRGAIAILAVVFLLITIQNIVDPPEDRGALILLILMAVLGVPYLLCEAFRTRFEYDNETLEVTTAIRKIRTFPWTEIIDVDHSDWRQTSILRIGDGTKIAASDLLSGSDALTDFARKWKRFNLEDR